MEGHERNNPNWAIGNSKILQTIYWKDRCLFAEHLLKHVFTCREIGRACHINDLEEKVVKLRKEITYQREVAEYRNKQLKAANLIVLCTGGCEGGIMGNDDKIDETAVSNVEMIAKRLRSWLTNHYYRSNNK